MRLPTQLKMLIGLGLAMTAGKSQAQTQSDSTPLHKIVLVDGSQVKLGREFISNTLQIVQSDETIGHYHFSLRSKDGLTEAELDVTNTNDDDVLNTDDEYTLRVRQQKGDVRQEVAIQASERYQQGFVFRNGHHQQDPVTVFTTLPDPEGTAALSKIKTKMRKDFPGLK